MIQIKEKYISEWNSIKKVHLMLPTSWQVMDRLTNLTDDVVKEIYSNSGAIQEEFAIIAIGGYARREMAPHSDVDILIFHKEKLDKAGEAFINNFTSLLWDTGLNPGIQIKRINEIESAAIEDEVVKTSFLDNRFLTGNKKLYESFISLLTNKVINKGKEKFLLQKIAELRNRTKKFRDSIYKIEPNIKEGSGGVRDINTIYWISKTLYADSTLREFIKMKIIDMQCYDELLKNAEFIFKVRSEIHYFHNRKYDVLNMDSQKTIAENLGYLNTSNMLAVEVFLMDYYKSVRKIKEITERVIDNTISNFIFSKNTKPKKLTMLSGNIYKFENLITTDTDKLFVENPANLINIFFIAAKNFLKMSDSLKNLIKDNLYMINNAYIKKYGQHFIKTISSIPYSSKITNMMAELGILQKFIPEFEEIICKAQFDMYHHYTVDEHTILAINYIDRLYEAVPAKYGHYKKILQETERKDLLILSILLHDIGKGQGKNHSVVGARMAKIVCKRLGMSLDDIDTIANLVENHLVMSHISQRRDIHDIEVIEHFTNHLNNIEELKLIYLLTYGDMNAVGGSLFTDWKNSLLTELYERSEALFSQKDLMTEFLNVVENKKKVVLERLGNIEDFVNIFNILEDDYIYSNKVKHIIRHIGMIASLHDKCCLMEYENIPQMNALTLTICTKDSTGLLKKLAGAISYAGLNILGAQIYTFGKNIAVDTFQISAEDIDMEFIEEKIDRLKRIIESVLSGNENIDSLLTGLKSRKLKKKTIKTLSQKIVTDNNISSQYSVIDVYSYDYKGLLYDILKVLEGKGIYVHNAKISTDIDRVVDSFSITDINGNKLADDFLQKFLSDEILLKIND